MKDESQKELVDKYPRLYKKRYGAKSCMSFGFCVGDGWFKIINELSMSLETINDLIEKEALRNSLAFRAFDSLRSIGIGILLGQVLSILMLERPSIATFVPVSWTMSALVLVCAVRAFARRRVSMLAHYIVAEQVKEKFGSLRFYVGGVPEKFYPMVYGAIGIAESKSGRTCEDCGEHGKERDGGWIKTLCDKCETEREMAKIAVNVLKEKLEEKK